MRTVERDSVAGLNLKNPLRRQEKCPPLQTAGSIGDVIRHERVAPMIDLHHTFRRLVSGIGQGQRRPAHLSETGQQPLPKLSSISNLSILRRRLQSARMREASGRKRRVRELPEEPLLVTAEALRR